MNDTDILADTKTFSEVIESLKEAIQELESKWVDTVSTLESN